MYIKWDNRGWTIKKPCHQAEALDSLQDTLETSLFANQLFPTVDCPEESQVLPLPNAGLRHLLAREASATIARVDSRKPGCNWPETNRQRQLFSVVPGMFSLAPDPSPK